jgi:hypothetical protein
LDAAAPQANEIIADFQLPIADLLGDVSAMRMIENLAIGNWQLEICTIGNRQSAKMRYRHAL